MTNFAKRSLAMVLALVMCISLFAGLAVTSSAETVDYRYSGNYIYNWGYRGETATFLSPNAEAFYDDNNITYEDLAALEGSSSTSSVPSSALYKELASLMKNNHSYITSYDATRDLYQYTDCQGSALTSDKISSFYSGAAIGPSWGSSPTWNREHTWPNSKGLGGSDENDIMMLRPTATSENSSRGNKAYGKSSGYYYPNSVSGDKYDLRGDVARIFLYVYVRWGNVNGNGKYTTWGSSGVMESKDVLLEWMEADPVDTWELGRNDSVESITGTRNVFVDYPELAFLLFDEEIPEMTTPSGEAANSNFSITPVSGNSAYGSVSLTGNIINASPAAGYAVAGYDVISGSATVTQNGNAFTVTPNSDCTIQINFIPKESLSYAFAQNGVVGSSQAAYAGDVIVLPEYTGEVADGYQFLGWVTSQMAETSLAPTQIYAENAAYTLTENVTFYALYCRVDATTTDGCTYALATDVAEGDYLIVADSTAMKAATTDKGRFDYTDITIVNSHIAPADSTVIWHIAPTEDGYYTLYTSIADAYAGCNNTSEETCGLMLSVNDLTKWSITFNSAGIPVITNRSNELNQRNYTLRKNSSLGFSVYAPATGSAPMLYEKTTHTMLYSTQMDDCTHANTQVVGQVQPSCSASGNTGDQVCMDCGTLLEAKQPVASTSHTDANGDGICDGCKGSLTAYKKASSISVGDTVLLVCDSENMELSGFSSSYGEGSEYNEVPAGKLPLTVVEGTQEGTFAFYTGSAYLNWSSNSSNTLTTATSITSDSSWTVDFDDDGNAIILNATDSNRKLRWNASNPRFACYNKSEQTMVQLYVLNVAEPSECTHSNITLQNVKTGSCTVDGYTGDEVCLDCGKTVTTGEVITAPGHGYSAVVKEPTLTEEGYTTYTCSACGDSYVDDYTAPLSAVAQIGDTYYFTVTKALIAAKPNDTITMIADSNEAGAALIIYPGVTLDLGSNTLTADYVIGLEGSHLTGTCYVKGGEYGQLVVDQNKISLDSVAPIDDAGYTLMPVRVGNAYVISRMITRITAYEGKGFEINEAADSIEVVFQLNATKNIRELFVEEGTVAHGISLILSAEWANQNAKLSQEFEFINAYTGVPFTNDNLGATLNGYSALQDLSIKLKVVSETGVEVTYTYKLPGIE